MNNTMIYNILDNTIREICYSPFNFAMDLNTHDVFFIYINSISLNNDRNIDIEM